jgi:AcrR family transcriptional regulator
MAASHAVIMDAVYALLQEQSVRDLTMEAVAKQAGVGKPTLYKWWPTKATLVLAMLVERMAPKLEKPTDLTGEDSLRFRVRTLIDAFNGPFGKIVTGVIAEGQSEPAVLQEFFERWVSPRRNATIAELQRGKDAGELRSETEPELLNDAIFGAIYYRMLLGSGPLTRRFGEELVEQVILGHRSGNPVGDVVEKRDRARLRGERPVVEREITASRAPGRAAKTEPPPVSGTKQKVHRPDPVA